MDKNKAGYIEGVVSICINTALFALKLWAGIITGSLALTADAWHTFSDSFSSIIVVIAVKLSLKKADKEHPFGHGRWEQIASIVIASLLGVVAFSFLKDAIGKISGRQIVKYGTVAVVVTIISIVVKELLAQYAFYIARKSDSIAVKADAWHHRTDALSSVVVLAGILFAKQFWWIDSVLGAVIAFMLFYAAYEIIKEATTMLLGEEPTSELVEKITNAVRKRYAKDFKLHHFHIHNYIMHKELTLHIRLDKNLTIETGHKIATDIENIIESEFGIIATIHVEPLKYSDLT